MSPHGCRLFGYLECPRSEQLPLRHHQMNIHTLYIKDMLGYCASCEAEAISAIPATSERLLTATCWQHRDRLSAQRGCSITAGVDEKGTVAEAMKPVLDSGVDCNAILFCRLHGHWALKGMQDVTSAIPALPMPVYAHRLHASGTETLVAAHFTHPGDRTAILRNGGRRLQSGCCSRKSKIRH